MEFLKYRDMNKTIYVNNEFQKFASVPAIRVRDESQFLNMLVEHVKNDEYFLYGSDTFETVTKQYNYIKQLVAPAQQENMLLVTSKTNNDLSDITNTFKNKFVQFRQNKPSCKQ
jgi:hypothetical protein